MAKSPPENPGAPGPSRPSAQPAPAAGDPRLRSAFKTIVLLATLSLVLAMVLVWRWKNPRTAEAGSSPSRSISPASENLIQKKFPYVNFSTIYPGLSSAEIDRLQRDFLGLRYVYAPFVEFAPLPVEGRFVNIVPAGFRKGRTEAPWPPLKNEYVVFVFGGSTTLGFGLPDAQTVVSALEESLAKQLPGKKVRCYNFGRGYYFSTQERQLFESLLEQGIIPNVALFIDGLNDFVYYDGVPQLTPELFNFTAPDLPVTVRAEPSNDNERAAAVAQVVDRYQHHVRLTEVIASAHGVSTIFVGQPVPFLDFPGTPATYPFQSTYAEHKLCGWGYGRFKDAARNGRFGGRFVWCGDAFARTDSIMYVDSIHYSRAGADALAKMITARSAEIGLLPWSLKKRIDERREACS